MKAVILAGGLGTRLSEDKQLKPKPMVEIGSKPIIWHIMKIFSHYNINEFIVCCGHQGHLIKEYFANYFLYTSDVTFHMDQDNLMELHRRKSEPWKVTLIDTGEDSQTGSRLRRVRDFIGDERFCFTYGDGVANIDISSLINFHQSQGRLATLTAVQPPGRYGALRLNEQKVMQFQEKPEGDNAWISGGFFVLEPSVIELIDDDQSSFELEVLPTLAKEKQLSAYLHSGFWQPIDTMRDRSRLEKMWVNGSPPWKIW